MKIKSKRNLKRLVALMLIAGCQTGSKVDINSMNSRVQIGMTTEQVKSVLGEPTAIRGFHSSVGWYSYMDGDKILIIKFENDKCVSSEIQDVTVPN